MIVLAGPTVLSAVGVSPPHDGVRRRWRSNVAIAVAFQTRAKNLSNSPSPSSRLGRLFLPFGRNSVMPSLGACPNRRCSILSESDSTLGYEQVFSSLEYRSDTAAAAECAEFRAERPCLAVYR